MCVHAAEVGVGWAVADSHGCPSVEWGRVVAGWDEYARVWPHARAQASPVGGGSKRWRDAIRLSDPWLGRAGTMGCGGQATEGTGSGGGGALCGWRGLAPPVGRWSERWRSAICLSDRRLGRAVVAGCGGQATEGTGPGRGRRGCGWRGVARPVGSGPERWRNATCLSDPWLGRAVTVVGCVCGGKDGEAGSGGSEGPPVGRWEVGVVCVHAAEVGVGWAVADSHGCPSVEWGRVVAGWDEYARVWPHARAQASPVGGGSKRWRDAIRLSDPWLGRAGTMGCGGQATEGTCSREGGCASVCEPACVSQRV